MNDKLNSKCLYYDDGDFTVDIFGLNFPNIAMKFCEERKYAEDIADGKIYMKESGYFRKLEDTYRGDPVDGLSPLDMEGEVGAIQSSDGKRVEFVIEHFSLGFHRDNKIPIFCVTLLDENILELKEKVSNQEYKCTFKKEFLDEISQFGKHIVLFNIDDFLDKANKILLDRHIAAKSARVEYVDIMKFYDPQTANDNSRDQYLSFFKKDNAYKWQNEWRIILINKGHTLIGDDKDFYVMELEPLYQAQIIGIDFFMQDEIVLTAEDENNNSVNV